MLNTRNKFFFFFLLVLIGCKQSYEPPAIKAPNHFLVVDGVINMEPDSKTTIKLSRTRNLTDTFLTNPESNASIQIESKGGTIYSLAEQSIGVYEADHLTLNPNETYRLHLQTTDGSNYLSDFVAAKQTPPIDTLTWEQNEDVTVYTNTHDPSGKARYYRWDFTETWHYRAFLFTAYGLGVNNGIIFYRDDTNQIYNCWQTMNSTDVVLSSSVRLDEDVIFHYPVTVIPKNSPKLDIRYSILVRQYALTEDAYNYWDILRKNSQTLGTLFDAQPGQLNSNIHKVSNPGEPVIGYLSACNITEKRLFINNNPDLVNWHSPVPDHFCQEGGISQDPSNPFIWNYPDTSFVPWYFLSPSGIMIAQKECVDCRVHGGTNHKPSFW